MSFSTSALTDGILIRPSSWSIASWAPFAFLGVEISKNQAYQPHQPQRRSSVELQSPVGLHLDHGLEEGNSNQADGNSGKYLGIMNLYTTLPQFMSTGISWIVFNALEPGKSPELSEAPPEEHHSTDGPNGIAVCLFIGACSACVAALATRRFKQIQGI